MNHLGPRVSALVDGQLGHEARDRALAHVAHCDTCRGALEAERAIKSLLDSTPTPQPSERLLAALHGMAEPGGPVGPRTRPMPLGPVVPTLPPPGRGPLGRRRDSRRPAAGSGRTTRSTRARYVAVGALSVAGLVLGTAFAAGGSGATGTPAVVPPAAELSVEHAATTAGLPLGDPAFTAVTASFGGLTVPGVTETVRR
ncbi:MAG: anti-sigma factor family protein [Actinomycetes bacterium]